MGILEADFCRLDRSLFLLLYQTDRFFVSFIQMLGRLMTNWCLNFFSNLLVIVRLNPRSLIDQVSLFLFLFWLQQDLLLPCKALIVGPDVFHHHLHEYFDYFFEGATCRRVVITADAVGVAAAAENWVILSMLHVRKISEYFWSVQCFIAILDGSFGICLYKVWRVVLWHRRRLSRKWREFCCFVRVLSRA